MVRRNGSEPGKPRWRVEWIGGSLPHMAFAQKVQAVSGKEVCV